MRDNKNVRFLRPDTCVLIREHNSNGKTIGLAEASNVCGLLGATVFFFLFHSLRVQST